MSLSLTVVGGVYRERCLLPVLSDETWGSGGRAATVTSGFQIPTTLYTATDSSTEKELASLAETFGFKYVTAQIPTSYQFHYVHALSPPNIWPPTTLDRKIPIKVEAQVALVFGMLEANVEIDAATIVYDPQSPFSPQPLRVYNKAAKIAYVLNASEAARLSGESDVRIAGKKIVRAFNADAVVIKRGPWGALVFEGPDIKEVPAYRTGNVWPIGSGDVFAATFAAFWAAKGLTAQEAAALASRAAATYVDTRVLPIPADAIEKASPFPYEALKLRDAPLGTDEFHVYLAGPFFNIAQLWLVEESRIALSAMGLRVFSPYHEIGLGAAHDVAPQDIEALKNCRVLFALVDGLDPGTLFEVGYARAIEKPVIALASSTPDEALKMISGTYCEVLADFVTAIYRTSWAAKL